MLGEIATGGDVRGTDRDRAAEALRDGEVERTKAGSGATILTSSVFGRRAGGARAMILVNLFKVKGITAMFCSLTPGKPKSAATDIPYPIRRDPDRFGTRCPGSLQAGAGRQGPRARSDAVLNTDAFQFGKQAI
jgi:hypothetical protein